ncbi:MAG: zf-TFIIB domain-containing protein [Bacteroidales bacterium]|nr:zf-TFIIB domain-containing protein [Bacteroidales bacterium]
MNCPNCNVPLVMSERQGIEIDYCPQCRGIWLDRGELDKIIEKSSQTPGNDANYPPKHHSDNHDRHENHNQHDYYKNHRKKSWLNELFD